MSDRIVKWRRFPASARVGERLAQVRDARPPGVVPLLGFGWTPDGLLRLELEKCPGTALSALRDRLDASQLRGIGKRLFGVLEGWRNCGFVHGDLSPRNILVTTTGELWCIDFLPDLDCHEGTPAYASPEVYRGRHTPRSDLFAATQILRSFEMSCCIVFGK